MIHSALSILALFAAPQQFPNPAEPRPNSDHPYFGCDVSLAGDVDRDGVVDYAFAEGSGGAVWIVSGKSREVLRLLGRPEVPGPHGARSVRAGDWNADGVEDLLVTRLAAKKDGVVMFSGLDGSVLARFDAAEGVPVGDLDHDGRNELVLLEKPEGERSRKVRLRLVASVDGHEIARLDETGTPYYNRRELTPAGDLDLDGQPDVFAFISRGIAALSGKDLSVLTSFGDFGDRPPASIAGLPDMDRDGVPDVLVGHPDDSCSTSTRGAARIVSGKSGLDLKVWMHHCGAFGCDVRLLDDLDADGLPEIVVGSHGEDLTDPVWVFSLKSATEVLSYTADADKNCHREPKLCAVPDVDGDGARDLLIGSPSYPGACNWTGYVCLYSTKKPGQRLAIWRGDDERFERERRRK